MSVSVQESLLDMGGDGPVLGALEGSVRRTPLAHGAWVDFCPGWLAGSAEVFGALVETVPRRAEGRQRGDRGGGGADGALRPRARRAVPDGGAVPVPGRARQRRVARGHDRARPD